MKKAKTFSIGKRVTWRSQAQGMWTTKTGRVVEVVDAGRQPKTYDTIGTRDHVSYVVEVIPPPLKSGKPRDSIFYWPVAKNLRGAR